MLINTRAAAARISARGVVIRAAQPDAALAGPAPSSLGVMSRSSHSGRVSARLPDDGHVRGRSALAKLVAAHVADGPVSEPLVDRVRGSVVHIGVEHATQA